MTIVGLFKRAVMIVALSPMAVMAAHNVVHLKMGGGDAGSFSAPASGSKDKKVIFRGVQISVNGSAFQASELETRGQSCLGAQRRCFGADFKQDVTLNTDDGKPWTADGFNLSSMYEDTGYINNKIGYGLSAKLGLTTVKTTYVELVINGRSQGLYLAVQKPNKVAKKLGSGIIIRRREKGWLEMKKFYANQATYTQEQYTGTLERLYAWLNADPEERTTAYNTVKGRINMPQYFNLLTLNSLLMNGDYSDELYFYARPKIAGLAFDIMPWDFEDLFAAPHDSPENKRATKKGWFKNTIMYSFEDGLDISIRHDATAHAQLNATARNLLKNVLTPALFRTVIDEVKASINPYLTNANVMNLSRYDGPAGGFEGEQYSGPAILKLLEKRYLQMVNRRAALLKVVDPTGTL